MAVPACAHDCRLVQNLIIEVARLRGTTEAVERVRHGLDDGWPYHCVVCTKGYASIRAADACCRDIDDS